MLNKWRHCVIFFFISQQARKDQISIDLRKCYLTSPVIWNHVKKSRWIVTGDLWGFSHMPKKSSCVWIKYVAFLEYSKGLGVLKSSKTLEQRIMQNKIYFVAKFASFTCHHVKSHNGCVLQQNGMRGSTICWQRFGYLIWRNDWHSTARLPNESFVSKGTENRFWEITTRIIM